MYFTEVKYLNLFFKEMSQAADSLEMYGVKTGFVSICVS